MGRLVSEESEKGTPGKFKQRLTKNEKSSMHFSYFKTTIQNIEWQRESNYSILLLKKSISSLWNVQTTADKDIGCYHVKHSM